MIEVTNWTCHLDIKHIRSAKIVIVRTDTRAHACYDCRSIYIYNSKPSYENDTMDLILI